ncbi:Innexin inx7 [Frankliniella fusca]|uniref:Innexin n=1 Tax=Frankliniella fusca TaxID=407009 RepID=A0AAE1HQB2_9NEOP|nr:Innexin inx7 [Frankliniella fusca]
MLKTFEDLQKQVSKQVYKSTSIDNVFFRLHYRLTFWLLLTATILVSSRQYIGEHIRCIAGTIAGHVVETYCFFTTTFTIPRYNNDSQARNSRQLFIQAPHPGVGPLGRGELEDEAVVYHAYYQWVPFVLFGQAIMFYLPHLLWRLSEGGTIKVLVEGLEYGYVALLDKEVGRAPSRPAYMRRVGVVRTAFVSRLRLNRWWGQWLIGAELLNALNLVFQFYITDWFLGGRFIDLGATVTSRQPQDADPLDLVFPKVTKCIFRKYGPTGTIQTHDAMCVMALNVINEKIYTFLWFWYLILGAFTAVGLFWRVLTLLLHNRSDLINKYLFDMDGRLDPQDFETVISRCDFSHWLFLRYLCQNMHISARIQLFKDLAEELRDMKSNGYHNRSTLPRSDPPSYRGSPPWDRGHDLDKKSNLDEPDGPLELPLLPRQADQGVQVEERPHSD